MGYDPGSLHTEKKIVSASIDPRSNLLLSWKVIEGGIQLYGGKPLLVVRKEFIPLYLLRIETNHPVRVVVSRTSHVYLFQILIRF